MKKGKKEAENPYVMLGKETADERYKRYKHRRYCQLILQSILYFIIGLLLAFITKGGK